MAWAGSEAIQEAAVAPPAAPAHLPGDRSPGPGGCFHACLLCSSGQPCWPVCSCLSLIHSFIHLFSNMFSHTFFIPPIRSFLPSFIHPSIQFNHSFIHSFVRSFVRSFIYLFILSFSNRIMLLFTRSMVHCECVGSAGRECTVRAHSLHVLPPMLKQSPLQPCMHLFSNCCKGGAGIAERLCCLAYALLHSTRYLTNYLRNNLLRMHDKTHDNDSSCTQCRWVHISRIRDT